ncbi:hypothetical protein [Nonomuraea typhae]|uniref:hypothetical protein n=1 Tax=Nonomuraea typhae TaxID=2603600 RepID=UPI0012F98265|nr:hypothetical protein [Nonomuraea typhae]
MDDQQTARNLALARLQQAASNLSSFDTKTLLDGVRRLRAFAAEIEDDLMRLRPTDIPPFSSPR